VLTTHPLTVAPRQQIVMLNERHPSDIVFLPDVNRLDSGYVFLTQSSTGISSRAIGGTRSPR